jgi:hypothetical protein
MKNESKDVSFTYVDKKNLWSNKVLKLIDFLILKIYNLRKLKIWSRSKQDNYKIINEENNKRD